MSRTTRVRGQGDAGFQGQVVFNHGAGLSGSTLVLLYDAR